MLVVQAQERLGSLHYPATVVIVGWVTFGNRHRKWAWPPSRRRSARGAVHSPPKIFKHFAHKYNTGNDGQTKIIYKEKELEKNE